MKKTYVYIILSLLFVLLGGTCIFLYIHHHNTLKEKEAQQLVLSAQNQAPAASPTTIPGEYTLTKNMKLVPIDPKTNKKVVLITIDDGPTEYGPQILSILKKHNVKAIFFVNGIHSKAYPHNIAEEAQAGSLIGNHTWDHQNLKDITQDQAIQEIDENTKLITQLIGQPPRFFRPPYGVSTPFVRNYVKQNNMIYMNWGDSALDWEQSAHDETVFTENIDKGLYPGDVILLHEHQWTVTYLDDLLTHIEKEGYGFVDPNTIVQ